MRPKIQNLSSRPDSTVIALAEFAASFFPHVTGAIPVIVKNAKGGCGSHGRCYGNRRCVIWLSTPEPRKVYEYSGVDGAGQAAPLREIKPEQYPQTFDKMHYFRHANHDSVKPLTVNNWQEHCLAIIAHEMEHTTQGNQRMRRSRQEIHAWNREVEVLNEYRKPENQATINARIAEIQASQARVIDKQAFKKTPDAKIIHVGNLLTKWQRRLKLAQTKIRKLKTRMIYYERKQAASGKAAQ